ncbi:MULTISPECIES: TonB-dependent receptor [unclassified Cellvibrio]|uniref:TonB-dependent receptor n=1 Tax=unclassified Cellvibrio TaxID=2624793 RepID=UPI001CD95D9F|nr:MULTISPECIES: TonB-dependent receptor [unclassified Cellvibrio]UUA74727.1 TonB-dependent receptor [Cellvibrio sp. QJXJ]
MFTFNKVAFAVRSVIAASAVVASTAQVVVAQENSPGAMEEITVTGIRASLTRSLDIKREANTVVDSISAEDAGKFPDLNVAESLQRITGVSIDRSGGEGQAVTVRGLGPQFNNVLVNGRQVANDSGGREFNFDVLSTDLISGADVYKSTNATMQDGGIGATINISTAKPLDNPGLQLLGSIKGTYETLSEKTSPGFTGMISQTFMDDTFGVLAAFSHEERDVNINSVRTATWRPGLDLKNADEVIASNVSIPRNWAQVVDAQSRTRDNANLVFQFAPSEDLAITLDGSMSKFEVDSLVTDLSAWFEPSRISQATVDPTTRTALFFEQQTGIFTDGVGDPFVDLVSSTTASRDVTNIQTGLNIEWQITEKLQSSFDISRSTAENDRAGKNRFNVMGIKDSNSFDSTTSVPVVQFERLVGGNNLPASEAKAHYSEINGATNKDAINEYKVDFVYEADAGVFQKLSYGVYRQEREKEYFQKTNGALCNIYCGYNIPVPEALLESFTADNFFAGAPKEYWTYDGDAYIDWMVSEEGMATAANTLGRSIEDIRSEFYDENGNLTATTANLRDDRYTINEDVSSVYVNFDFEAEIADMPVYANFGARYSKTDITVAAIQSNVLDIVPTADPTFFDHVFSEPTALSDGGSYANLLPSLNVKMELTEDMVLRFAKYDSITRPTMSELSPATSYSVPRNQALFASGGNPALKPFKSANWDVSYEWYYGESSALSVAFFSKEIEDFIVNLSGLETITMANRLNTPNNICATCDGTETSAELSGSTEQYLVSRPQNGEVADVTGFEFGVTHTFDSGFGFIVNATVVDSNASLGGDTATTFALEGLGDSQNLVVFYEADNWQARAAFNNREPFLRYVDNGNGEPVNGGSYGQLDLSASYDLNDNVTVFVEAINVTEEELYQYGRSRNQVFSVEDNGSRYALGVRAKF